MLFRSPAGRADGRYPVCYTASVRMLIRESTGSTPAGKGRAPVKLSLEEVDHVAMLARLGLTADECERMREQLSSILDHIGMLNEIDTEAIPPTAQVIALQNVMRPDEVRPSLPLEAVLRNAPQTEDEMFKVNAVLEQS